MTSVTWSAITRWVGSAAAALLAVLFLDDATSSNLAGANPAHGHLVKGCYTLFDDWFRTAVPSGTARYLELVFGVVLLVVAVVFARSDRRFTERRSFGRLAGIVAGVLCAWDATAAQAPATVPARHRTDAVWFDMGVGVGANAFDDEDMGGGKLSMFVAPGLFVGGIRASNMSYLTTKGVTVSEGGPFVGLRTPGQSLFLVGAVGFSYVNARRACPSSPSATSCADPPVKFKGGALGYSIQALKNTSDNGGFGLGLYGTKGSERASFYMLMVTVQLGWFAL